MEAVAKLRNTKGAPRKARLITDIIKGKDVERALNILRYNSKQVSKKVEKLVESAINNWEQKNEGRRAEESELYIKTAFVDGGPVLKRFQPAPFGRAHRIRKRTSHITVVIDSRIDEDEDFEELEDIEELEEGMDEELEQAEATDENIETKE